MVETVKTQAALLTEMADGGKNTAEEVRDGIVSMWTPSWLRALDHTVAGDSPDAAFYWNGSDLGGFTEQTVSGTATWTEAKNLVSVILNNQASGDVAAQLIAASFTVGDEWVLPIMGALHADSTGSPAGGILSAGIIFADGTTTTSNCVFGHLQIPARIASDPELPILVGRHGTLTDVSTAPWVSDYGLNWSPRILYIKLIYQAADTFRLQFSSDGVSWSAFGEADISKTMTPTHVGVAGYMGTAHDAIATFGPLLKNP